MGEIDMRPIESVQAALSLFGQKSDLRKYRSTGSEEMEKEKELDLVFKDLANYKVQLEIKESVNMQALLKLEVYRKTIEELTTQLKNFEADRDKYLEECREAQTRIEKLELENKEILDQHLETWKAQEQLQCTVGELQATQEEMLNLKAELAAADESKLTVLRQAELMKIAIEMEKEKTEELLKHISELNEAILSSKFAAIEAEKENYVILSGKEAEIEMATVAAMQAQEQLEEVSKRLDMMEDVENQLLAKSLFVDSLQLELKQTKESHSSSARAASDAIDNINRMKLELDVMARVNSERVIYIESMEMQLKRSREDLDNEREKVVNLNNQIELITLETQEIKNRVAKIEAKELEAQVEIAMLKSELHKGRSRIAAAEAAEASSKSIKSGICLAVQQLAVEAEEVKKENRRLKQEANKEEADDETANFLTLTLAYESLIRNNKKANCRNNGSPPENILKLVESGSGCELDTLKKELETANADIRNLRSVTEQALRRAEIAEKAKIEVEDHLRKWKEQKQRRRAALAALREESTHMDKGNPLMYNSMRKTCKPLAIRPPSWISKRRMFEQSLSELHKCSDLNHLKQIQAQIFKANLHQDHFVAPKLISAFAQCRQLISAVNVFNQIQHPNTLLYNTLIRAYIQNSQSAQAFSVFFEMQRNGVSPDNFSFPFLLKACTGQFSLRQVQMIHTQIIKYGFSADIFVPNSLIDSYFKCGASIDSTRKLFDAMDERDVVSWNSMIAGLVKAGELGEARRTFDEMPERDSVSWNTVLDGYAKAGEMNVAFELFEKMPERNIVSWTTMISGYCKACDMDMARLLFDKMPVKNLVTWTIMISAYAEKGITEEASRLYDQMEKSGRLKPDIAAVVSILSACAESGMFGLGKRINAYVDRTRLKYSTPVCNALVDMYAKCGNLDRALKVFDGMVERDVVSWNSMLQGLAMHGHGERALNLFSRMREEGVAPDGVTFVGVLCACTHVGLVDEAHRYFSGMERYYGVVPQIEHYGCMIDLLGRGGHLKEAFDLIKTMPMEPNAIIWGTLLGACRTHNNVALAEEVVDRLIQLEPSNAGNYALLSNIYAAAGRWDNVAKVRLQMKDTGVQKPPGSSSIEVDDVVHEFTVGDRSHPQSNRILKMVNRLAQHLKQVGYVPNAHF